MCVGKAYPLKTEKTCELREYTFIKYEKILNIRGMIKIFKYIRFIKVSVG